MLVFNTYRHSIKVADLFETVTGKGGGDHTHKDSEYNKTNINPNNSKKTSGYTARHLVTIAKRKSQCKKKKRKQKRKEQNQNKIIAIKKRSRSLTYAQDNTNKP